MIKVLSKKTVLDAKLFTVFEVELEFAEGKRIKHLDAERRSSVCVFPLTDLYEIYLISQYRYLLGRTVTESVAGFIDENETSIHAAKRELKEETGISAMQLEEIGRLELSASAFRASSHLFLAKGLEFGESEQEEGEDITLVKMSLKEAVKKVIDGEIVDSSSVSGILLLETLRREKKL